MNMNEGMPISRKREVVFFIALSVVAAVMLLAIYWLSGDGSGPPTKEDRLIVGGAFITSCARYWERYITATIFGHFNSRKYIIYYIHIWHARNHNITSYWYRI